MPRLQPIDPENASGKAKTLLEDVQSQWGMVPNLIRTLANAPAALDAYLHFQRALGSGALPARLREQIAICVAEENGCDYCRAAHCAIGKTVGLTEEAIADARRGAPPDSKTEVALQFAREMVVRRGWVRDDALRRLRETGYTEQEIVEIIANVALNLFSNYFNHIAATDVDFPKVPELTAT